MLASQASSKDLSAHGIVNSGSVHWNLGAEPLYENTIANGLGTITAGGALRVETGKFTGRSPNDKFIVDEPSSTGDIWWGSVNRPTTLEIYERLKAKILAYYQTRDLFVQDLYAGAAVDHRLNVRVISDSPWHALFARNMFIRPAREDLDGFDPQFTVLHAPMLHADPATDGTNSEVFIVVNFAERTVLVGGSRYAGEIKKSIFSIMNYLLPARGVLPMHCSANIGDAGDTAIFFGLSGTGKTTLSADGTRRLIGDDEHGWSDQGVFNFEGGCYAKVINLSQKMEPEIYATTQDRKSVV